MKKKKQSIYSEEFKWKVVREVISGRFSKEEARKIYGIKSNCAILYWMRKYSGQEDYRQGGEPLGTLKAMSKKKELTSKDKRIKELEESLQRETIRADLWQKMVELAEEELNIDIIKKYGAKQSTPSKGKKTEK